MFSDLESGGHSKEHTIDLAYSLNIEATAEPDFFALFSPDLEGFTGVGHSVEDCLFQAKYGMLEHIRVMLAEGLPVPAKNPSPRVVIENAVPAGSSM